MGLDGVREVARKGRDVRFTALMHHITPDLLAESFLDLKRSAAAGVDGVTWREYENGLEDKIVALWDAVQSGRYRAQPSRRVYIPKADGSQRPLGIAALEDKIVQQAVATVLSAIYEADFLGFSYGFRPERGQHDALDALCIGLTRRKVNWVLDADIKSFFDTIDHDWMMRFLEHRIADGRVLRLIRKWLTAGVIENGKRTASLVGTPQGAVILPLLANVYLHYVFDLWTHRWRRRDAMGDVIVVRYADDSVVGFEFAEDARVFRKRRCDPIDSSGSKGFSDVRFFRGTAMSLEGSEDERECDDRNGFWRRICRTCGFSSFTFGQSAVVEGAEGPDRAREPRAWSARRRCRPQISDMRAAIDAMAPPGAHRATRARDRRSRGVRGDRTRAAVRS